ncbi:MAG TPA: heparan-alpha-glucosaminide N-acetyltransferase domain-containing protein, partial [Kineosporiaceae bacterium]
APTQEAAPAQEAAPPGPAGEPGTSTARLAGVDLARALAVFGMFAVHVGPDSDSVGGVGGWLLDLAHGRSSVLFATLAGFSLMLIAGRREPKTGPAGRQARIRIAIRALILLALGTLLTALDTGIAVILAFYGVYFLLALPLVRLRAGTLATIAAVLAVVGPQVAFGLTQLLPLPVIDAINEYDPLVQVGGDGVLGLLLTGTYPVITWMPFVIAGMALGRLDLAAGTVQRRLGMLGPALMVLGYGTSWLASQVFESLRAERAATNALMKQVQATLESGAAGSAAGGGPQGSLPGTLPPGLDISPAWTLLTSRPHSGTSFEVIGSLGFAITVLVGATVLTGRLPWLRRLASPVIAVGTMSLTLYVAHVAVFTLLPRGSSTTAVPLLGFIGGAVLFAAIWSRFFRRGPLEYLLNTATKAAKAL